MTTIAAVKFSGIEYNATNPVQISAAAFKTPDGTLVLVPVALMLEAAEKMRAMQADGATIARDRFASPIQSYPCKGQDGAHPCAWIVSYLGNTICEWCGQDRGERRTTTVE